MTNSTSVKQLLAATTPLDPVTLHGWVRTRREAKEFSFIELNDGSSHELDLYRYEPLEDWVLALEARAFPDRAENSEQDNGEQPSGGEPADPEPAATDQDQSPTTP